MRVNKLLLCVIAILQFQQPAFSLEQSATIKVTPLLKTETSWDGQPIVYPEGKAEITGMMVEIAPGGETSWHLHEVPSFGVLLEGELEVTLKDGRVKQLKAGDALVEVVNTLHNGRNTGATPAKMIVFYAGAVGKQLTIKEKPH